jgi:IMP and pyridine-specific 5'-nucleotidase
MRSRLRRIVPTVGSFFTPLKLVDAFREYDSFFHLSRRRYIPPNFAELRHILNIAQVGGGWWWRWWWWVVVAVVAAAND